MKSTELLEKIYEDERVAEVHIYHDKRYLGERCGGGYTVRISSKGQSLVQIIEDVNKTSYRSQFYVKGETLEEALALVLVKLREYPRK